MRASDTGEGPVKPCKAILHLTRRRKTLNAVQTFPDEKGFSDVANTLPERGIIEFATG